VLLIAPALLLSIMLTLGRFYRDSEMTALSACGVGPGAIYRPLFLLGVPMALMAGWLSLHVVPQSMVLYGQLEHLARQSAEVTLVKPGMFREVLNHRIVVYANALSDDGRELRQVFILDRRRPKKAVITGERGELQVDPVSKARYVVLYDGYQHEANPGDRQYRRLRFERLAILIDLPPKDEATRERQQTPTSNLLKSEKKPEIAELHRRLSSPVSLLIIVFITPLLARAHPREGKYGRVVAAILVFAIYFNLLGVAESWLVQGSVPAALGLWWVHGILVLLGCLLWVRYYGAGFRFPGFRGNNL
jgi:lipopolysaccharide export system permease protein